MTQTPNRIHHLREIVKLHDVVYEVRAHQDVVESQDEPKIVKNGFDVSLCGTHDHGHSTMTPGCERCVGTYRDLEQLARWIMPAEERPSAYEIHSFDNALHSARLPNRRLEVALTLQIKHRHGWDEPIDDCEERCLKEIEEKLKELGVRRR